MFFLGHHIPKGKELMTIFKDRDNLKNVLKEGMEMGAARPFLKEIIEKMLSCGREEAGFATYKCEKCGEEKKVPFSCKTRFCNRCGVKLTDEWVERIEARMINVPHRHIIFTLPSQLWNIFAIERSLLKILVSKGVEVLTEWGKGLGVVQGMTGILHTFGEDLGWKPHVHFTCTEGGLTSRGKWKTWYWERGYKQPYISFKFLQERWRAKILLSLKRRLPSIWEEQESMREEIFRVVTNIRKEKGKRYILKIPHISDIQELIDYLFTREWCVNAESRLTSGVHTIRYIGRYSKRPVIAGSRIISYDGKYVGFLCDSNEGFSEKGGEKILRLPVKEFIKRLLRHIPDKGFRMINHFGLYAQGKWNKVKEKLRSIGKFIQRAVRVLSWSERIEKSFGRDPLECPGCGGKMLLYTIHYLKGGCMKVKRYLLSGSYISTKEDRVWIGGINKFTKIGKGGQLSFI